MRKRPDSETARESRSSAGRYIPTPREAAARTYARWIKRPSRIEYAAEWALTHGQWDSRDRALFFELVYGVVRWHGRLQWLMGELSRRDPHSDALVYAATAVGMYQLLFLDRIPDYAAVDSAVDLTRRVAGPQAAAWTNALLRRCAVEAVQWKEAAPRTANVAERLAASHSHPLWMLERWQKRLAGEKLVEFLNWNNRRPDLYLRVSGREDSLSQAMLQLEKLEIGAEPAAIDPSFLKLQHSGDPAQIPLVRDGQAAIQDVSQGLVSRLLHPQPGERVLDLCAAPGGKTGHLAELCPDCRIVATDKSEERLRLVTEMASRRDYGNVSIRPFQEVIEEREPYDAVLVDAPCTGTGVLARRPDLRWRRKPDDVPRMAATQLKLLSYAESKVALGGRIIYSTCSVEPEENLEVVNAFLQQHRGFGLETFSSNLDPGTLDEHGCLSYWGPELGADGVFAAVLRRKPLIIKSLAG